MRDFLYKSVLVARIEAKMLLREKMVVFFNFVFPFFMLFMFGLIWGADAAKYAVSMVIAVTVSAAALFSLGAELPVYRETGTLKRIVVSPISGWNYIMGMILARGVMVIVVSLVLMVVAGIVFNFQVKGSSLDLGIALILGILCLFAMGGLVASVARNPRTAATVANVMFTPLMFLSGAFIPIHVFPEFLQSVAAVSPVYHFIELQRGIMLDGSTLAAHWLNTLALVLFFVGFAVVIRKTFRLY